VKNAAHNTVAKVNNSSHKKRDVHEEKLKRNLDKNSTVKETKIESPLRMYFYSEFVNEMRDRRCQ